MRLEVGLLDLAQAIPLADSWGMHGDFGWGWMLLMMIPMLLFWGAIIFGVVWLIRSNTWGQATKDDRPINKESPVEILERRFAEGAMTLEDYQARRKVLVNGGSTQPAAAPK
jgi:putative membrane protein